MRFLFSVAIAILWGVCTGGIADEKSPASPSAPFDFTVKEAKSTEKGVRLPIPALYDIPVTENGKPGQLLGAESFDGYDLPPGISGGEAGLKFVRFAYHSRSALGQDVPASGVIITPYGPPPKGGWPVVVWAHGTSGVGRPFGPSLMKDLYYSWEGLLQWPLLGYAVVAPDYAGLGTPVRHEYMTPPAQVNDIVNAVAAARRAVPPLGKKWIAIGHSQGGSAVLALAERETELKDPILAFPVYADQKDLATSVRKVFTNLRQSKDGSERACVTCHNPKSDEGSGTFNDILDFGELHRTGLLDGPNAQSTRLYKALSYMPLGGDPLPAAERTVIEKWIAAGAPSELDSPSSKADFIAFTDELRTILGDLKSLPERERKYARYFTLTHLSNGGLNGQLPVFQTALAKLINSLSWQKTIKVPLIVPGSHGTILRIDLRNYRWTADTWNTILSQNPYGNVDFLPEVSDALESLCGVRNAAVRADWFLHAASRPPLYHDILGLPTNDADLEKQLGVNVNREVEEESVVRAGFRDSGVSIHNRMIERHAANYGAYWKSYDFASDENKQNLVAHPLDFEKNGGEIIFNLPNGLQAYLLTNAKGQRLDEAPVAIVQDKKRGRHAFAVLNGISCMRCHSQGMIRHDDVIRNLSLENQAAFSSGDFSHVQAIYAPGEKLNASFVQDETMFASALTHLGIDPRGEDPVFPSAEHFEDDLGVTQVAAELGLTKDDLLSRVATNAALRLELGFSAKGEGKIARSTFLSLFGKVIDELKLAKVTLLTTDVTPPSTPPTPPPTTPPVDSGVKRPKRPLKAGLYSKDGDKKNGLYEVSYSPKGELRIGYTALCYKHFLATLVPTDDPLLFQSEESVQECKFFFFVSAEIQSETAFKLSFTGDTAHTPDRYQSTTSSNVSLVDPGAGNSEAPSDNESYHQTRNETPPEAPATDHLVAGTIRSIGNVEFSLSYGGNGEQVWTRVSPFPKEN